MSELADLRKKKAEKVIVYRLRVKKFISEFLHETEEETLKYDAQWLNWLNFLNPERQGKTAADLISIVIDRDYSPNIVIRALASLCMVKPRISYGFEHDPFFKDRTKCFEPFTIDYTFALDLERERLYFIAELILMSLEIDPADGSLQGDFDIFDWKKQVFVLLGALPTSDPEAEKVFTAFASQAFLFSTEDEREDSYELLLEMLSKPQLPGKWKKSAELKFREYIDSLDSKDSENAEALVFMENEYLKLLVSDKPAIEVSPMMLAGMIEYAVGFKLTVVHRDSAFATRSISLYGKLLNKGFDPSFLHKIARRLFDFCFAHFPEAYLVQGPEDLEILKKLAEDLGVLDSVGAKLQGIAFAHHHAVKLLELSQKNHDLNEQKLRELMKIKQ